MSRHSTKTLHLKDQRLITKKAEKNNIREDLKVKARTEELARKRWLQKLLGR